jgi:hypothetical protein
MKKGPGIRIFAAVPNPANYSETYVTINWAPDKKKPLKNGFFVWGDDSLI